MTKKLIKIGICSRNVLAWLTHIMPYMQKNVNGSAGKNNENVNGLDKKTSVYDFCTYMPSMTAVHNSYIYFHSFSSVLVNLVPMLMCTG